MMRNRFWEKVMVIMLMLLLGTGGLCACGKKGSVVPSDSYEDTENDVFPTPRGDDGSNLKEHSVLTRYMSDSFFDDSLVILHSGNKSEYSAANLIPDAEHHRAGVSLSGAFDGSVRNQFQIPAEYQPFEYVCFWMYLEQPCAASVRMRLNCSGDKGENSYFTYSFPLEWSGWKLMTVPFGVFSKHGGHNPDITTLRSIRMEYVIRDNQKAEKDPVSYIDSVFFANDVYEYDWATNREIDDATESALDTLKMLLKQEVNLSDNLIETDAAEWIRSICVIDSLQTSAEMNSVYEMIYKAARAYAYADDENYHNRELLDAILDAMYYMDRTFFSRRNQVSFQSDNWWHWEIGVPTKVVNTLVVLSEDVEQGDLFRLLNTVDRMNRLPARDDANQLSVGYCAMVSAILQKDYKRVIDCREILAEALKYTSYEGGFYEDGSYIDHVYIPYTGSYGCVYISSMSKLITILSNGVFEFERSTVNRCVNILKDSFVPFLFRGAVSASVRGRSISRSSERDITYGTQAIESMILLYPMTETASAERMALRRTILSGYEANKRYYKKNLSPYATQLLNAILKEEDGLEESEERFVMYYPNMDRAAVTRENWAAYISLSGSRIAKYEAINGENQTGWYTGDGMLYLYTSQKDYGDAFWKGLDYYKIPGTTVTNLPRIASNIGTASTLTDCDFVGGCVQGDTMAVAMEWAGASETMDFQTSLTGKKAWFIIDDMILCMGTDIRCTDDCEVYTVIENRIVDDAEVLYDGKPAADPEDITDEAPEDELADEDLADEPDGDDTDSEDENEAPGREILGEARSFFIPGYGGIISYGQDAAYRIVETDDHRFLQAEIPHGVMPESAGYCYAVYPLCEQETFMSMTEPSFEVIRNDGRVTAVSAGDTLMIVFWSVGECYGYAVDHPCILIVGEDEMSLCDPTHTQEVVTVSHGGRDYPFQTGRSGATVSCSLKK